MRAMVMLTLVGLIMLTGACIRSVGATSRDVFPAEVFPALCQLLVEVEGIRPAERVIVLGQTRPIHAMGTVRMAYANHDTTLDQYLQDELLDDAYRQSFEPIAIEIPERTKRCRWVAAKGSYRDYDHSDDFILELSNLVRNPYIIEHDEPQGFFARFSVGGRMGASWYWVALRPRGDELEVARILSLDISDG